MSPGINLAQVITHGVLKELLGLHVAFPGRVEGYTAAKQKANIKPLLKMTVNAETKTGLASKRTVSLPVLTDIPVVFPQGGGFFLSTPLTTGDKVLVVVCERSLDEWLAGDGREVEPRDRDRFSLAGAVAIPGVLPFSQALNDASSTEMIIGKDQGLQLHISANQARFVWTGHDEKSVAIAELLQALWTTAASHVHPTAFGPSGASTNWPAWDADINSDLLKVGAN